MNQASTQRKPALFVFAVLAFATLGIGTYWCWDRWQAEKRLAVELGQRVAELNQRLRDHDDHVAELKSLIGFDKVTSMDTIRDAYQDDVLAYGGGLPDDQLNYRTLVGMTLDSNRRMNGQLAQLTESNQELLQSRDQLRESFEQQIEVIQQSADRLADQLADQREAFNQQRDELRKTTERFADQLEQQRREKYQLMAEFNEQLRQLESELNRKERLVANLSDKLRPPTDDDVQPDGYISLTEPASEVVWINLGSADGLRSGVTFSVYETRDDAIIETQPKATIEVARIAGEHLAEARVTDLDDNRFLFQGDAIHSPIWNAGSTVGVAIAGRIDFDADGQSDFDRLRQIVGQFGGSIDFVLRPDGEVQGELTADTRYLIVGESPDESAAKPVEMDVSDVQIRYEQAIHEARTLGIERIGPKEFLDRLGWRPPRIEQLTRK